MNGKLVNLYGHYLSIPSCNVGLILSMDGIAHSYQHVDLTKGVKKEISFQALNYFAQVPAIVLGSAVRMQASQLDELARRSSTAAPSKRNTTVTWSVISWTSGTQPGLPRLFRITSMRSSFSAYVN